MEIKKGIICICCGKRFYVVREEYEERREESLCDSCLVIVSETDKRDDTDVYEKVSEAVSRVTTRVGETISSFLKERENKQVEKNNILEEDDDNE